MRAFQTGPDSAVRMGSYGSKTGFTEPDFALQHAPPPIGFGMKLHDNRAHPAQIRMAQKTALRPFDVDQQHIRAQVLLQLLKAFGFNLDRVFRIGAEI